MKLLTSTLMLAMVLLYSIGSAQERYVTGIVMEENEKGEFSPLISATVFWLGTGTGTATDTSGYFKLKVVEGKDQLVVSYVGYQADTIQILDFSMTTVILKNTGSMITVEVDVNNQSTTISFIDIFNTQLISEEELFKAACCNLSESFETNPAIDVSFTDAITGTRQLRLLGLLGSYTQLTRENIPSLRGLASISGLSYVPGSWISSIQLTKGAGSVVNGYESIAGQINYELKKPDSDEDIFFNLYGNQEGRIEGNLILKKQVSKTLSTGLLLHSLYNSFSSDHNNDTFLDLPLSTRLIGINRWKFDNQKGIVAQAAIKGIYIDNLGGQLGFNPDEDRGTTNLYGVGIKTQRVEGWAKLGYVFPQKKYKSVGLQLFNVYHNSDSYFGLTNYLADQQSFYANLIYQSLIVNSLHKFKTGLSYAYDHFSENLNGKQYNRTENVPGVFFEYSYTNLEKLSAVAGLRADYHDQFGAFVTPRLHLKYMLTPNTVVRGSAGRGLRVANIFAEHMGILASSRTIKIMGDSTQSGFGLDPEIAWNYGVSLAHDFRLNYRGGVVSIDFYRTDFINQVILDLENDPTEAVFYNLAGESYSNSFQFQIDYEPIRKLEMRLAYRWYDVMTTYNNRLLSQPLISQHLTFLNAAYKTKSKWHFDYTIQWQGPKRIPNTSSNPENFQLDDFSPSFFLMNAQIAKSLGKSFQIYLGMENILHIRQMEPIISASQPFGPYFDSSLIWGPIFGRMAYIGLRYTFEKDKKDS